MKSHKPNPYLKKFRLKMTINANLNEKNLAKTYFNLLSF